MLPGAILASEEPRELWQNREAALCRAAAQLVQRDQYIQAS